MIKACYRKRHQHTFLKQFSNTNCYFIGMFRFATPIRQSGKLNADSLASNLMPVESNSLDISRKGLHQNDFPINF